MKIIYARERIDTDKPSVFLAGPTPRDKDTKGWRLEAIRYLNDTDCYIFVPEPRNGRWTKNYIEQVEWEEKALTSATVILFWIPRNDSTMLGLTTNDEWGHWKTSGKCVLGVPEGAFRTRYQEYYANKLGIPFSRDISQACDDVKAKLNRNKNEE
jgi:hypothetical protein